MIKNTDFAKKCKYIAENVKTLYVMGGWGQPLTDANKQYFIKNYSYNAKSDRQAVIKAASNDTFAFDCNCFIKSVIDGFCYDLTQPLGGATYGKPCPDISIKDLLKECEDVSTAMTNIKPGELLVYKDYSHCGIYVGDNTVVECTYRWDDGVQFTILNQAERKDMWGYHGKMTKYIDYTEVTPAPTPDTKKQLQNCVKEMQALCTKMNKIINTL